MSDELIARAAAYPHDVRRKPMTISESIALVNDLAARVRELEAERDALRADAEVWRHIAQEHYSLLRRARDPNEMGYAIEGSLDALHRGYRKNGKYSQVFCSQCGRAFLHHNYHGYSHCEDHQVIDAALAGEK